MSVTIEVVGETAKDVIRDLLTLGDFYINPAGRAGVPVAETDTTALKTTDELAPPAEKQPEPEVIPPAPKPRGRPKKEQVTIDATVNLPEPEKQSDAEPQPELEKVETPNIEAVRAALMKLAKAKGEDDVFKLLGEYSAKSASGVAENKRAELIAAADKRAEAS